VRSCNKYEFFDEIDVHPCGAVALGG
jgi:hypothetical protein